MKIIRSFLTIGGFTFLSRIMGLIREILMARFLGATDVADAFFFAFKFPNFFRRIFAEGAFNAAFVPLFSGKLTTHGKKEAKDLAEQAFSILFCFLCVFVALVVIFAPYFVKVIAAGFASRPEQLALATTFVRITFPYILFISLAAHLSGVLNSIDRFAAAAGVPIILNIVMILGLLAAPFLNLSYGMALSLAVSIAGALQLFWLYLCCWRLGFRLQLKWPRLTVDVRKLLKLMVPGAIGAGVMNINFLIDTMIASFLPEKSISYIFYADRLNQLPLSIFGIAIGTALLPLLSRQLKAGEHQKAHQNKVLATEFALQLTIPAAFGLCVLSYPLIHLIYRSLPIVDAEAIAAALCAFSLGIPAYVLNKVFITGFFARQDTKTPVKVASACILANIVTSLSLMGVLKHVALALAVSVSAWINTLILYYILKRRGWFALTPYFGRKILVMVCHSTIMAMVLWQLNHLFLGLPDTLVMGIAHVLCGVGIGVGIVAGLGIVFKTFRVLDFKNAFKATES